MSDLGFFSGMLVGMERSQVAATRGDKPKSFDWNKAATILKERGATYAEAGLLTDWPSTGGCILRDGKPVMDDYTYLASMWAIPTLRINGEDIPCFTQGDDFRSDDKWPESALAIFNA